MKEQLSGLGEKAPAFYTIPVGSLSELSLPLAERIDYALLTCSRLAPEKHVDLLVRAVAKAREQVPQLRLDIYGTGSEEGPVRAAIQDCQAQDYVHLLGHKSLEGVYERYSAYVSASTSEGFGLTLMEAVGSGLPLVGFDVPYGNQTFIEDGKNGYRVPVPAEADPQELVSGLAEALVRLFTEADRAAFEARSYEKAQEYLSQQAVERWERLMEGGEI